MKQDKSYFSVKLWAGAAFLVFSSGLSHTAQAGFEWNPPKRTAGAGVSTADDAFAMQALPMPPVDAERPSEFRPVTDQTPVDRQALAVPAAPSGSFEKVEGFGRDIPLALAMSQIIPSGYSYSFDSGIDPGLRISWDGGRPWNVVLEDAVAAQGLSVETVDGVVWVRSKGSQSGFTTGKVSAMQDDDGMASIPLSDAGEPRNLRPVGADEAAADQKELAGIGTTDYNSSHTQSYPRRVPPSGFETASAADFNAVEPSAAPADAEIMQGTMEPIPLLAADSQERERGVPRPPSGGAIVDLESVQDWQAKAGDSLRYVLGSWAKEADVELYWASAKDFRIPENIEASGTFPEAVAEILDLYADAGQRPTGTLHPNLPAGPSVLIIRN